MAIMHRRDPPPGGPGGVRPQQSGGGETGETGPNYVGVDNDNVRQSPDQYVGQLFRGAHIKSANVPSTVAAGGEIQISGIVHLDNPLVTISSRDVRVTAEGSGVSNPPIATFQNLSHCNTRSFSLTIPAPATPGTSLAITLAAESHKQPPAGWSVDNRAGPYTVEVVSGREQITNSAVDIVPYAMVGAGGGYLASRITDSREVRRNTLVGAGLGAGGKLVMDQVGPLTGPDLPTGQVAIIGGVALAGAYFLNSSGLSGVLGGAGEAAGAGLERAADRVRPER